MTHLQAVSGQNVAFVLVLLAPALTRLRWRARLPLTLLAIGFTGTPLPSGSVWVLPGVLAGAALLGVASIAAATRLSLRD